MTALDIVLPLVIGAVAGAFNAVAGGGSLLTIPLLAESGLGATVANATNRVGVAVQATVSSATYAKAVDVPWRFLLMLLPPAVLGGAAGAYVASILAEEPFRKVVAVLFTLVGAYLVRDLLRKKNESENHSESEDIAPHERAFPYERPPLWMAAAFVGVGFYGGLIQAGVGIVCLLVLHILGRIDLVRANAIKMIVVLVFTAVALTIFALQGDVAWADGLLLAVGGAVGSWFGSRQASRVNPRILKVILVVAVAVAASRFAGFI